MRSIRPERPVDPVIIEILRAVAEETQAEGIDYMLVGATARDVLLTHVFGLAPSRATRDVDFAIAVQDWEQFDAVKSRLIARGRFKADSRVSQRLYYTGVVQDFDYQLDLVPFGGIARPGNEIAWPPDMETVMNVAGYDDVLAAAEHVEFAPRLEGKVVSLPGLAILKLVAWSDRGRANPRDAHDLIHLMDNYAVAGNFDRVYEVPGVIEAGDYDPGLAGVVLLGKDFGLVASTDTLEMIRRIIERDFARLAGEMVKAVRYVDNAEAHVEIRLRLLLEGFA